MTDALVTETPEAPAPTPVMLLQTLCLSLLNGMVLESGIEKNEFYLCVAPKDLHQVLTVLRDHPGCLFHQLIDLCGVDYPSRPVRFDIVYHLLGMKHNHRVRVMVAVADGDVVPSIVEIYPSATWFEREAWDMYGVAFDGNTDMRRLLTDYGFEGHPLRKDFPLTGFVEVRYDETQKRVIYEPVKLNQDFRHFDFVSPWEGMTDVHLPGDEKAVRPNFWSKE